MMKAEYIIMQGTMRLRHCTLLDFSIFTVFFQACIFDNFLEEQSSAGTLQDFICFLLFQLPLVKTMKNCCMYFYVFESTVNEEKKMKRLSGLKLLIMQHGLSMMSWWIHTFFVWVDTYPFIAVKRVWINPKKKGYGSTKTLLTVHTPHCMLLKLLPEYHTAVFF